MTMAVFFAKGNRNYDDLQVKYSGNQFLAFGKWVSMGPKVPRTAFLKNLNTAQIKNSKFS